MFVDLKQAPERSSRPKESPDLPLSLQLFPGGSRISDGHTPPPPPLPSSTSALFDSVTALEDSQDSSPLPPALPQRSPSFLRSLNLAPFVDCDDAAVAAKEGDLKWGLPSIGSARKEASAEQEEEDDGILATRGSVKSSPHSIPSSLSAVKDLGKKKRRSSRFRDGIFAKNLHAGGDLPPNRDLEWSLPSFQSMREEEEEEEKQKEKEKEKEEMAEEDKIIARGASNRTSPPSLILSSSSATKDRGKTKSVSCFGKGIFAKNPHADVDCPPKGDIEWALPSFQLMRKEEEEEQDDGIITRGLTNQTSPSSILSSSTIKELGKKKSISRFRDGVFAVDSEPSEKFNTSLDLGGIFQASDKALAGRQVTHNSFPSEKVHDSLFLEKTHNSFFPEKADKTFPPEKTHHSLFPEKTHHSFFSEEARSAHLLSLSDLSSRRNPTTSQRLPDEPSLWCGLVRYGESCSFRAVGGCLGDLKLGSRLRKLPNTLIAHKLVDIKSFLHSLQKGTSEPVVQFALPDGAPPEDAESFRTMAEKLSGASESRRKDEEDLQLELGRQSFSIGAYFAAAVLLQDDLSEREETEFYIIAPSVLEHVLEHWSLPTSVIMPKEVDLHDHSKLYGFFFPCIPSWSFERASDNVPGTHTLPLCLGGKDGKISKGDGKISEGFDKLSSEMGLLSGFNLGQASVAGGFGSKAKGKEHAGYHLTPPHIEKGCRNDGGHCFPIQADGDANWWDNKSGKGLELGMMLRESDVGIPLEGQGALDVKMEEMADDIRLGPLGMCKSFSSFNSFNSRVEKGETKESKKRERGHNMGCEWKPLKEAKLACEREMDSLLHVNLENKDAHETLEGTQCDTSDTQLNRITQPASSSADALLELTPAKVDGREVYCEFSLNGLDRESRSWLLSKQSELYLQENYGVSMMLRGDNSLPGPKSGVQNKGNIPLGPVHVKISMAVSNSSEVSEGKWFVSQAAYILKAMALRGVYLKCIWYGGPVQLKSGDGAPLVSAVVKKIKGEDGKNLERIEEMTGVLIGVVLRKGVVTGGIEASSKKAATRVVGLRLKSVVRKGLLEASKQAGALLLCVADHFAKRAGSYSGDGRRKKPPSNELIPPSMAAAGVLPVVDCSDPLEDASVSVKKVKEVVAVALDGMLQEKQLCLLNNDIGVAEMGANVVRGSREKLGAFTEMAAVTVEVPRRNVALDGLRVEELVGESDLDMLGRVAEYPAASDKPNPLYLTELMRNVSAHALKRLFEDIIGKYIWPSSSDSPDGGGGRKLVLDVRYVPTRGCAFVDLATTELVDFMLDLHHKRPDVFHYMKMGIGKRQQQFSESITNPAEIVDEERERGEEEVMDNRRAGVQSHLSSHHGSSWSKATHSGSFRRSSEIYSDANLRDLDYIGDSERGGGEIWPRKHRSDPEKTVYADRLPDNASESLIRRAFEQVLLEHMSQAQKDALGSDGVIQEVRHIPPKYCAFVVFASEELTRLVLQLYNQDEDIFDGMRLKPHFHSRMEDLYQDEFLEQEADVHPKGMSMDPHSPLPSLPTPHHHRGSSYEQDDPQKPRHVDYSRSSSSAHRAVAATAFKEVDRRRSVYVDRIPEKLSESLMRDTFENVLRRLRHGCDTPHMVSQVTFFRDKFDSKKLCAFVEVRHEDATQDLIDCYHDDEEAFLGMRIRSALKYH